MGKLIVTAEDALNELERLVGEWTLQATGPGGEPWPGEARTSVAWHDSGAHLVSRTSTEAPGAPKVISIMGCGGANRRRPRDRRSLGEGRRCRELHDRF